MNTFIYTKDPEAVRTYGLYWGNTLAEGDTISSTTWTVPAGLTKEAEGVNAAEISEACFTYPMGTVAEVRLSGGDDGVNYECICHIVTANGDEDECTVTIVCKHK